MKKLIVILMVLFINAAFAQEFSNLIVGEKVEDFTLKTIQGDRLQLSSLTENNKVVLIVLRGWPEYQCPVCSRQVGQFIAEAEKFQKLNTMVLFVYPGPSGVLQDKAKEFTEDFSFPKNFYFTLDPDYTMINKYGLRWNAPKETAFPATFIIDKKGIIEFSKISKTHGGRASVDEVLNVF